MPWKQIVEECYDQNLSFAHPIVRIVYADSKDERAVILQRPDTLFTISFEKLYPFDEDELRYSPSGLHGYWGPNACGTSSFFDSEENAMKAILSERPFKHNKAVLWSGIPFRIEAEELRWIKDDGGDDPNDFCLHGHVTAKIGDEMVAYDATVSAAGLYLLRTLTSDHIIREAENMLPCCGHSMFASDDLSAVDIIGCPNGVDWSVFHEDGRVKLVTEGGKEVFVGIDDYRKEVFAFADQIEAFYRNSLPKNLADADELSRNGYIAFWNEWRRRRGEA